MVDYSKGLIYKIVCLDNTIPDCYVGSTCDFKQRRYNHKSDCTNPNSKKYDFKLYETIRKNGGWNKWRMVKICDSPANDYYELKAKEVEHIRNENANLNINDKYGIIAKHKSDYNRQYYEINKEKIKERKKERFICECGGSYTRHNRHCHLRTKKHINYLNQTKTGSLSESSSELETEATGDNCFNELTSPIMDSSLS